MPEQIEFRSCPADQEPARGLIAAMVDEIKDIYGGAVADLNDPRAPSATPGELGPPHGATLVGFLAGEPVAVGAIKRLDAASCEFKRMYVAPAGRSRGLARKLLAALEAAACELGYAVARLDTGSEQPYAKALYLSAGYTEIEDYNDNPFASFWAEKDLRG